MIADHDDLGALALSIVELTPYLEYTVYPVIDANEAVLLLTEAIEFRDTVH